MAQLWQNVGHLILMLILLIFSAYFSGAETAFFNLTKKQVESFRKSKNTLQNLTAKLLEHPNRLLNSFAMGNMVVNVLFYAISSVFILSIEKESGVIAAGITAFGTFLILLLFGEILPKSLCYITSKSFSVMAALPASILVRVFTPVVMTLRYLIVVPVLRLIVGPSRSFKPISTSEFKSLLEHIGKSGLITRAENRIMTGIIELGGLKVRDCLTPRVDLVTCNISESNEAVRQLMHDKRLTKIPVYLREMDNIVGTVHLRHLLLHPQTPPAELVQKVHFVPEHKTIESLLEFFRKNQTDFAIVVDEYGGISGSICIEDIAEELLGPIRVTGKILPIEQLGPFKFRFSGNLSIYDWADAFGIDPQETGISTMGGLVTAVLGRIPRPGDTANIKNIKFTVENMKKRRVESVIVTFEPISENDN